MKRRRWPRPADTAVDRARAIAREYRDALAAVNPDRCAVLDRAATEFGEDWVCGTAQFTDSELVTLTELAELLGEKRGTVWAWWNRGLIPREPNGLFRPDAVMAALRAWRVARENRSTSAGVPLACPAPATGDRQPTQAAPTSPAAGPTTSWCPVRR